MLIILTKPGISFILFVSNALTETQQNWTRTERYLDALHRCERNPPDVLPATPEHLAK